MLTAEGAIGPVQIDVPQSEAAPIGDIVLPGLGETLEQMVDRFAGPLPDQLRADIAATLSIELRLGQDEVASVNFGERGIGTFQCRYAADKPPAPFTPEAAMGVSKHWGDRDGSDMTGRAVAGWGIVGEVGFAVGRNGN